MKEIEEQSLSEFSIHQTKQQFQMASAWINGKYQKPEKILQKNDASFQVLII